MATSSVSQAQHAVEKAIHGVDCTRLSGDDRGRDADIEQKYRLPERRTAAKQRAPAQTVADLFRPLSEYRQLRDVSQGDAETERCIDTGSAQVTEPVE